MRRELLGAAVYGKGDRWRQFVEGVPRLRESRDTCLVLNAECSTGGFTMNTKSIALLAALLLCALAGPAGASTTFGANPQGITGMSPRLTFEGTSGNRVICAVTLKGSLHASAFKTRGTLMGFMNEGRASSCSNSLGTASTATPLVEFRRPWHITLENFSGTLPRITALLSVIQRANWLFSITGPFGAVGCLYTGNLPASATGTAGESELTVTALNPLTNTATLFEDRLDVEPFGSCDREGAVRGTINVSSGAKVGLGRAPCRADALSLNENPLVMPDRRERTQKEGTVTNAELLEQAQFAQVAENEVFTVRAEAGCRPVGAGRTCRITVVLKADAEREVEQDILTRWTCSGGRIELIVRARA